ncbi:hypothetical protein Gohar_020069, partial [Gossypium harknessii]|nr:hypothetical protein [Gossypium harknessii]
FSYIRNYKPCFCTAIPEFSCPENERQALLKIEQHLKDPLDMLADWRLLPMLGSSNDTIASRIKKAGRIKLAGKLSLALLDLKHLPYL